MLIFLSGNDHFRLRLRERALCADFQSTHPSSEEWIFDGRETGGNIPAALQESLSGGLFQVPARICIRHIELFDEKLCAAVIALLERGVGEDMLVVASAEPTGRAKKGNPFQSWLSKHATTETIDVLSGRALAQSITEMLRGIEPKSLIDTRATELLSLRTNGETGHIYHDLLKLVLATQGGKITETQVRDLIEEPAGESVSFALLEQIVRGNREQAVVLLRREEANEDVVFKLLGLFAWQVRQALMVRDEYNRGMTSPDGIATAIGAKPFSVKKLMPLIPGLSLERLKRSLAYLADLDQEIKTGQTRPGVALDLFIWKF
ncbi:MAG: DNA polymerase III subunit delta [Undibacterium sp.]